MLITKGTELNVLFSRNCIFFDANACGNMGLFRNLLGTTLDSFKIGRGTSGDKQIIANNADSNKPSLKYNDSTNKWQYSNNGVDFSDLGPGESPYAAMDLDFSSESNQTLSADTTYTIGGLTWTKLNSANDRVAAAIVNGSGLVLQPVQSTDYANGVYTSPGIRIPLSSVITDFDMSKRIRVMMYVSAFNGAANYDNCLIGIDNATNHTYFCNQKVHTDGNHGHTVYGQYSSYFYPLFSINSSNVLAIEVPSLQQEGYAIFARGTWASGFPAWSAMTQWATIDLKRGSSTKIESVTYNGSASQWSLLLVAGRAGSSTLLSATISRVKVEVFR